MGTTIKDGVIGDNPSLVANLWVLREAISGCTMLSNMLTECLESLQREGTVYKYDISLPLSAFYDPVAQFREKIGNKGTVVGYGHVGDGWLHTCWN